MDGLRGHLDVESAMNESFQQAIAEQVVWKGDVVMTYAVGFVKAAHALALKGHPVGSDDVDDQYQPFDSPGAAGSAIAMLRDAHVITDCFESIPALGIHGGRRRSKRESANGRKISCYRVCSIGAAEEFLRRNGVEVSRQPELFVLDGVK